MSYLTIRKKLIAAFSLVALVPVAVICAVTVVKVNTISEANFVDSTTRELKQLDNAMVQFADMVKTSAGYVAARPELKGADRSVLSYLPGAPAHSADPEKEGAVNGAIYRSLTGVQVSNNAFYEVFFGTRWGGFVSSNKGALPPGYDPRKRDWYQVAVEKGVPSVTPAYQSVTGSGTMSGVISVVAPAFDPSGALVGVTGIDVPLTNLTKMVLDIKIGKRGFAMLAQEDGTILANPKTPETNFKKMSELDHPVFQTLDRMSEGRVELEKDGVAYYACVYTSPGLGWKYVGVIEKEEVMASGHKMVVAVVAIGVVLLALFVGVAFLISNAIIRPINRTSEMLRDIAEGEGDLTRRLEVVSNDELGILATWFNAFVEKIHAIIRELSQHAEKVTGAGAELSELSDEMSGGAREMNELAGGVTRSAEEMSAVMTSVAASSEQTATNVNTVAAATEEMRSTIAEIAERSEKARGVTSDMVDQAHGARANMDALGQAAAEIGKVTETITEISEQTNLLALNATIEAARAGEAGKGFAVVAGEIKALAAQTAEATGEIRSRINGVQSSSAQSVEGISRISTVIEEVSELVGAIAAAVEEQSVSTGEIAENLAQASAGLQEVNGQVARSSGVAEEIARDMGSVSNSAHRLTDGSGAVHDRSEDLSRLAGGLNAVVGQFKV
ncbi:methyl-accepting chemotaxis protein [Desulfoluna spongiiphila]|uniref:Methyl-accepting chemotaxis sensory transducer with Cache sensor n=1 Tax=Desulfoluna spongiiphila TaxID=419481 RepID=A0A1G5IQH3_9BACT|nr:methyl-accepting chemotaxis protein [Desulfoluna spongiiphila]SCY78336.1 methyl-accepting chemotaxis sensory transducer with Cache sensor [Desulfoluna spongiiphila]